MLLRSDFPAASEGGAVCVENADGRGDVLIVCEHASNRLPERAGGLGLSPEALVSHIAWDPGALAVARLMAMALDATLVHQPFSRLIYDCNRPPESPAAMPEVSEIYRIPGNEGLSPAERYARTAALYVPFHDRIAAIIAARQASGRATVLVTVHSFTPVYLGKSREVEVGILHDVDSRLADAMLSQAETVAKNYVVRRNEPYGPEDGVTHTLRLHGIANALENVMIEVRNDLIADDAGQKTLADLLAGLLRDSLDQAAA